MKVNPVFSGKVHVTAIKDDNWTWNNYTTSVEDDKKILNTVNDIKSKYYVLDKQAISQDYGEQLREIIENAVGEKLDIPEDAVYSASYHEGYNVPEQKNYSFLRLLAMEKFGNRGKVVGDRTAIDIYI